MKLEYNREDFKSMNKKEIDPKTLLSTLWIFATLNYIYADVFNLYFEKGVQEEALTFTGGSEVAVLLFAVLMETAIAMVLISRILPYKINRWANIVVGIFHTGFVTWSLFPKATMFYTFFAAIEIAATLFIIWYAWKWKKE